MGIRVRIGSSPRISVRVGQYQATKLVSSSNAVIGNLSSINDIDVSNRNATNTVLMYNTSSGNYEHVSPYHIVDMSDATQDNAMDAGTF
mgnify:CR=1 FL=1